MTEYKTKLSAFDKKIVKMRQNGLTLKKTKPSFGVDSNTVICCVRKFENERICHA